MFSLAASRRLNPASLTKPRDVTETLNVSTGERRLLRDLRYSCSRAFGGTVSWKPLARHLVDTTNSLLPVSRRGLMPR